MRTWTWRLVKIAAGTVVAAVALIGVWLIWATIKYSPEYVYRVLAYRQSDVNDYLHHFPSRVLTASAEPFQFEQAADDQGVASRFAAEGGVDDWHAFLEANSTSAFIVIQNGKVLFEKYYNGYSRDSTTTSFSVAKSFTSALVGAAIDDGYIKSVDEPITRYLPELAQRDAEFEQITIRDLLFMSSGLGYQSDRWALFNGDDPLTTYNPDQRKLALENTHINEPSGQHFLYNKYHPQLLGMIIERATKQAVTAYLQEKIWNALGMEFGGSWSLDSASSGFEKMEAGLNARPIDFAKLGELYLNDGAWNGKQVLSSDWVTESTTPMPRSDYDAYYPSSFASLPGKAYYGYMWWGMERPDGSYDFTAEGDHGQYIYVSPSKQLVIVRTGDEYGIPTDQWLRLFFDFAIGS